MVQSDTDSFSLFVKLAEIATLWLFVIQEKGLGDRGVGEPRRLWGVSCESSEWRV